MAPARGRLGRSARAASVLDTHRDKSVAMMVFECACRSQMPPTTRYRVGDISLMCPVYGHDELNSMNTLLIDPIALKQEL